MYCRTKIVYKTAGVLLEEMRQNGFNALKYKVIILDEVHERSVESDLALVCLKQFLLKKMDIRLVVLLPSFKCTSFVCCEYISIVFMSVIYTA